MKYLTFERRYALESTPCERCAGSGRFAHPQRDRARDCMNCRGLGRKITRAGRDLFKLIAEQLGRPVIMRESRIRPDHLDLVDGRQVGAGMRVAPIDPPRPRAVFRDVRRVQPLLLDQRRLDFTDGTRLSVSAYTSLLRELTRAELDRVDAILASHLGRGALPIRPSLPRAHTTVR